MSNRTAGILGIAFDIIMAFFTLVGMLTVISRVLDWIGMKRNG